MQKPTIIAETHNTHGPECPYCGYVQYPEDGNFYDEGVHDDECGECGKAYTWTHYRSDSWRATPQFSGQGADK